MCFAVTSIHRVISLYRAVLMRVCGYGTSEQVIRGHFVTTKQVAKNIHSAIWALCLSFIALFPSPETPMRYRVASVVTLGFVGLLLMSVVWNYLFGNELKKERRCLVSSGQFYKLINL